MPEQRSPEPQKLTEDRHGIEVVTNGFRRKCLYCLYVPETLLLVRRPEDAAANRTWLGCPKCDRFLAWANKEESGNAAKTVRSSEFPSGVRNSVMERDNFRCIACGRNPPEHGVTLHVDHIVPVKEGGLSVEDNGVTLCAECNLGKGSRTSVLIEFKRWLSTVRRPKDGTGGSGG